MDRAVALTGLALVAVGLGLFAWKTLVLDLPLLPQRERGTWEVELSIAVRGDGGPGSVQAALPEDGRGQRIFGEHFVSDRLRLQIREDPQGRTAVWQGTLEDVHRVSYRFNAQLFPVEGALESAPPAAPGSDIRSTSLRPEVDIPAAAAEIVERIEALGLPARADVGGRVRAIFAFVVHEISARADATDDALLALTQRAGSDRGRERLFASLLRAAEIPVRVVQGLQLRETRPQPLFWSEVWLDGRWVPISASRGFFGSLPPETLALGLHDRELVESQGARALDSAYTSLREELTPAELAALMVPPAPILRWLSLYRLPVSMQSGIRVLLAFCLATLVVSVLRSGVGIPSYGTFMPVLLALSMRVTGLVDGLLLVFLVIAVGILGRLALDRLRLLFVPRLSIVVCLVVLALAALGLVGRSFERASLYGGIVLPIVILTMLIERISLLMVEEGTKEALVRGLWSLVIAMATYPLLVWSFPGDLLFAYPELVLVVMGLQVWMGGYTGYRLSELIRFRPLRQPESGR